MPTPFIMPKFDMDQEKATIVTWLKHEGDDIVQDEPVLVVETDKVAIDVPAPVSGRLARVAFKEGDVVPVTAVIAQILGAGESAEDAALSPAAAQPAEAPAPVSVAAKAAVQATPLAQRMAGAMGIELDHVPSAGARVTKAEVLRFRQSSPPADGKIAATPAARRVARERGLQLQSVHGSGPAGRIQVADVQGAPPSTPPIPSRPGEAIPLVGLRRTIAERMQASFRDTPHIALTVEADATALEDTRRGMNAAAAEGSPRVSLTALLVRLTAWSLERHPYLNASLQGDVIQLFGDINIGVATAIRDGLIVPVVHHANCLSVSEIVRQMQDLTEKARQGSLTLADVRGGTFTISNLGMFGVRQFQAVINPPESAILAVGAIVRKPVVVNDRDEIAVRPILSLTLSADHRVLDGVQAGAFLSELVRVIEAPGMLLY